MGRISGFLFDSPWWKEGKDRVQVSGFGFGKSEGEREEMIGFRVPVSGKARAEGLRGEGEKNGLKVQGSRSKVKRTVSGLRFAVCGESRTEVGGLGMDGQGDNGRRGKNTGFGDQGSGRKGFQVGGWFDDWDGLEWVEAEEVLVACDDGAGFSADGQVQELVVRLVGAGVESMSDFGHVDDTGQQADELLALAEGDVAVELCSAQYICEFFQSGIRREQPAVFDGVRDCLPGYRARCQ